MSYCLNPNCLEPQNPDTVDRCQACGSCLVLQNRYRPLRLIGQGGFGRTFLAIEEAGQQESGIRNREVEIGKQALPDTAAPALCVIKQLLPQHQTPDALVRSTQHFHQEAQQLSELGKHPQIPALLAFFQENQLLYLVQEWIAGTSLAVELEEQGAFSEAQIWQLLTELLPVLKFVHDHQVIHRDIKPANILRRSYSGKLVLVDFGAAKRVQASDRLRTGTSIGSAEYVAPEQLRGKAIFASDLYSLGVTCIHLLTQLSPFDLFDSSNHDWIWRRLLSNERDRTGQPRVSDALANLLEQLIESALSRRFQSAEVVMQAICSQNPSTQFEIISPSQPPSQAWRWVASLSNQPIASMQAIGLGRSAGAAGEMLVSASADKTLQVWDLSTQAPLYSLKGHQQSVRSLALHPEGKLLASGSDDKTIRLWDLTTQTEIGCWLGHTHAVRSVAFHPNGQHLASGSWDKTIRFWHIPQKPGCDVRIQHGLQVTAVAFSPDGHYLASASFDRTVRLWDVAPLAQSSPPILRYTWSDHTWSVLAVAFSPDGTL